MTFADCENAFLFLRRYKPDQVQRV